MIYFKTIRVLKSVVYSNVDSRDHSDHRNALTYSRSLLRARDPGKLTQRDVLWSVDIDV